MSESEPTITLQDTRRWGCIPVTFVVRIANLCSSGVDWQDCPKKSIYAAFMPGNKRYVVNRKAFHEAMNLSAKAFKDLKAAETLVRAKLLKQTHELIKK